MAWDGHEEVQRAEHSKITKRSPVATKRQGVVLLPGRVLAALVVEMTLAKTTVLLAGAGEATGLAVLVHGLGDPVDAGVAADLRTKVSFGAKAWQGSVRTALWFGSTRMTS